MSKFFLFKRFLGFMKQFYLLATFGFILILVDVIITFPRPLLFKYVVDNIIPSENFKQLIFFVILIVASVFFQQLFTFIQSIIFIGIRKIFFTDLRVKIYKHVQGITLLDSDKNTGNTLSRLLLDIDALDGLLVDKYLLIIQDIILSICIIATMAILDVRLSLVSLLIIPLFFLVFNIFGNRIYKLSNLFQKKREHLTGQLQEKISGKKEIQSFNIEDKTLADIKQHITKSEDLRRQRDLQGAVATFFASNISIATIIVLWGVGGYFVIKDNLTLGSLIAFSYFFNMLFLPFSRIFNINIGMQSSLASAKRIFDLLDQESKVKEGHNTLQIKNGEIEFNNVTFEYFTNKRILKNISFHIEEKKVIGLKGITGAGKTTIVKLLMRFLDPSEGNIFIDSQNIKDVTFNSLRDSFGIVHQDYYLFNASLKDNIMFNRDISTDNLLEVIDLLNLQEVIKTLPDGIETKIGENGKNLSGGQKQKIAIARALISKPKILIFDEPTSALDSESEKIFKEVISKIKDNHTIIIISHRDSTLALADKVIELKDAKIKELIRK